MNKPVSWNIPAWGTEEALRKEEHVARFLEREYLSLQENPVSLRDLGIDPSAGSMSRQTKELMEKHYDQERFLFDSFLDEHYKAYTMAYYGKDASEVKQCQRSVEEAQAEKFRLISNRIGIEGTERILNVGCGFGAFERYLLEQYPDIEIVGITPSKVQATFIEECMQNPNHIFSKGNFTIVLADFQSFDPSGTEVFDVVTTVGLIEAINNIACLNKKIHSHLKPGGKAFHHLIASKLVIPQFIKSEQSLIGKYFPGGIVWPFDEVPKHSDSLNFIRSWFINGMNYWKTLDAWHNKFWQNIDGLGSRLSEEDISYWNDYFILCKACFLPGNGAWFGNGHYLFRKPE
ncbi:SAM-dependent methyltransferase [Thiolapillus sp.]